MLLILRDESPEYGDIASDFEYVTEQLFNLIKSPAFVGLIDEQERGFMFGLITPQWYSTVLNAYEQLLYVRPEYRGGPLAVRLIKSFERMVGNFGAHTLYVGTSTGIKEEKTISLYERLGYERHGGGLRKRM
ncbi:GNAT family N-acetyltransferase [Kaustia mangrovi]|uniref:GNAT family N-acetyltransferase n=1 Tax=Kaustia mangrovi TaxID=2593653 RepID=A0A7S8HDX4_9HYPH|nr:GNAT family N-acetyltransferase [Kaustia mangrovi]QPC44939.1 GNAT family N-acetyltransferase [Kaustia mangrovi]